MKVMNIAQSWAKIFYNSKAWLMCRAAYIASVFGLCERCGSPGYIVHHKIWLTPQNINDPNISFNHDLLEYLCMACHNQEHHGSSEPLVAEGLMFDGDGNLIEIGEAL